MPINRLISLVFAPVISGIAVALVAFGQHHLPGHPKVSSEELTQLIEAGLAFTAVHWLAWLHGFQKWEARRHAAQHPSTTSDLLGEVAP